MTPEEAHRHEWFSGAATAPPPAAPNPAQCVKVQDDSSEGVFSASSSVGSGAERATMYHVYKAGKVNNKCDAASGGSKTLRSTGGGQRRDSCGDLLNSDGTSQAADADPAARRSCASPGADAASKRFDGNSNNLDDSGTFLPSIL